MIKGFIEGFKMVWSIPDIELIGGALGVLSGVAVLTLCFVLLLGIGYLWLKKEVKGE